MRWGRTQFSGDDMHLSQDDELAAAAAGYLSYAGPFDIVNNGLLAHHIEVSLLPNWVGRTQYRTARLQGSARTQPAGASPYRRRTAKRAHPLAPSMITYRGSVDGSTVQSADGLWN